MIYESRFGSRTENAETLHFALTPFQLLMQFWYALGFVGMVILAIFRSQTGWIVDYGPRSEQARQAVADQIRDRAHTSCTDIAIDFSERASWYDQEQDPTERERPV